MKTLSRSLTQARTKTVEPKGVCFDNTPPIKTIESVKIVSEHTEVTVPQ